MNFITSEKSLLTIEKGFDNTLHIVKERLFEIDQVLAVVYNVLCIFWFVYSIIDVFTQFRNKRRLVHIMLYDSNIHYVNSLFILNETIFRDLMFLMYLIFEIIFCLSINSTWLLFLIVESPNINISIGYNCTLESDSIIGTYNTTLSSF